MVTLMTNKEFKAVRAPGGNEWEIRRLGVMMENMNDNIMLLAEGQDVIDQRLGRVEEKVDAHTEMIAAMSADIVVIKEELAKKADKEDIRSLNRRIDVLEGARA